MLARAAATAIASVLVLVSAPAYAQRQIAEEPTGGVNLPATPLAGEHDARATTINPAGLMFIQGLSMVLAVDASDEDVATASGPGVGVYLGSAMGGGLLPRFGLGLAMSGCGRRGSASCPIRARR